MTITVTVTRKDPAASVAALQGDAHVTAVKDAVNEAYKRLPDPVSPSDLQTALAAVFAEADLLATDTRYQWEFDPVTKKWRLMCYQNSTIVINNSTDTNPAQVQHVDRVVVT